MQFDALPESDHPEVALRPIAPADLPAWLEYLALPEVYEHTSWNDPKLEDLARHVWSPAMSAPAGSLYLAIASRADDRLVGTIGFKNVVPEHRNAELGYDLAPAVWGRGIATHLCRSVVGWAHEHAGLLRVQAVALRSNAKSIRVLERAGFRHEGLLRSYRLVRGVPGDFHLYAHVVRS